ncbi:4'-phosphopantetheinyl transferase superfamily protein, partial [Ethanoligenens sp.]|uniref:4'-phosphopantetheinyl transferase superfamily protein n=1 Tax=Ethanoligenens sp. TaxID=2099655 RepID=UPI0039EC55D1
TEEYQHIITKTSKGKDLAFYKYWTLKESYIKHLGNGLSLLLNSFKFYISKKGIEFSGLSADTDTHLHFKQFIIGTEYIISICFEEEEDEIYRNVTCIDLEDVIPILMV